MRIVLGGFEFGNEPVSRAGSIFMSSIETGEGTEIDEFKLAELLTKFFAEVM